MGPIVGDRGLRERDFVRPLRPLSGCTYPPTVEPTLLVFRRIAFTTARPTAAGCTARASLCNCSVG